MVQTSVDPSHVRSFSEFGSMIENRFGLAVTPISCASNGVWYPWITASAGPLRGVTFHNGGGVGADDVLRVASGGYWDVDVRSTFSGTGGADFEVAVFVGDVVTDVHVARALGVGGDIGSCGDAFILAIAAGVDIAVKVRCTSQAGATFNIRKMTLKIKRYS